MIIYIQEVSINIMNLFIDMFNFPTFFFHSGAETLPKTTVPALVSLVFVHHTVSVEATRVDVILPDTPAEETFTSVTTRGSVVFAGCSVPTDRTELAHPLGGGGAPGRRHWA